MEGEPDRRLPVLDGWRTISVALVILAHLAHYSSISSASLISRELGAYGSLGVRIFFVISGFVICRKMLLEQASDARVSLPAFYIRRSFRILPPLALFVAVIVALAAFHIVPDYSAGAIRGLTFTCNVNRSDCGGYLGGHLWSLAFEEQFYLLFPPLFVMLGSRRGVGLTGTAVALPLVSILLYAVGAVDLGAFIGGFVGISLGVACALHADRLIRFARSTPAWALPLGLLLVVGVYRIPAGPLGTIANSLALSPLIAFCLLTTVARPSLIARCLAQRPMVMIGQASYGIYLWQQLATWRFEGAGPVFYAATVLACVAGSLLSFHWLERPLIRAGARWSNALQAARQGRPPAAREA